MDQKFARNIKDYVASTVIDYLGEIEQLKKKVGELEDENMLYGTMITILYENCEFRSPIHIICKNIEECHSQAISCSKYAARLIHFRFIKCESIKCLTHDTFLETPDFYDCDLHECEFICDKCEKEPDEAQED